MKKLFLLALMIFTTNLFAASSSLEIVQSKLTLNKDKNELGVVSLDVTCQEHTDNMDDEVACKTAELEINGSTTFLGEIRTKENLETQSKFHKLTLNATLEVVLKLRPSTANNLKFCLPFISDKILVTKNNKEAISYRIDLDSFLQKSKNSNTVLVDIESDEGNYLAPKDVRFEIKGDGSQDLVVNSPFVSGENSVINVCIGKNGEKSVIFDSDNSHFIKPVTIESQARVIFQTPSSVFQGEWKLGEDAKITLVGPGEFTVKNHQKLLNCKTPKATLFVKGNTVFETSLII